MDKAINKIVNKVKNKTRRMAKDRAYLKWRKRAVPLAERDKAPTFTQCYKSPTT
jgi:hypothetical protein